MITNKDKSQERIDTLEVVSDYKKSNANTIEVQSQYNPKTKARYFSKVSIDLNAKVFADKHITPLKRNKTVSNSVEKNRRMNPVYIYVKNTDGEEVRLNTKTLGYEYYKLFKSGIPYKKIAEKHNTTPARIKRELLRVSQQYKLGITEDLIK